MKIIISGGFGVGKTTMVGAVSEIEPLSTEERLTQASGGLDPLTGIEGKTTTTVALDFGRRTLHRQRIELYLFGTPGQPRFWFLWEDLVTDACGAVILIDTRRLADSFEPIGFFEHRAIPFIIAINDFADDPHRYSPDEVAHALHLPAHVPVVRCDARERHSTARVLAALITHTLTHQHQHTPSPSPSPDGVPT
ncbi:ATP-binding protein [Actinomadura sp. NEAU-AAG5]|uniref:ATP-binding protein n=2 Tax=Actinomadura litoris TaxID=2678616 RepID=A0A7K1LB62_9ACTN|nr:ATP-binding protein [Actinomadura litoris]